MKKILISLLLSVLPLSAAEFQLVESVPEGTEAHYGSPATARPLAVWLEMIKGAKKTLDIEQFYIADKEGEVLEPVLAEVKAAALRGVKVRFIVDAVMLRESGKSLPPLREAGVVVRVIDFKKNGAGGVQHAKFFIVDGKEVFVGSQNFDWRALKHIHELGVRIKSARAAADFSLIFEGDWAQADGKAAKKAFSKKAKDPVNFAKPETAVIIGSTGTVSYSLAFGPEGFINNGFDTELEAILKVVSGAKKTIRGQVMNYALAEHGHKRWETLDAAIRAAGARGVKVELVFANWTMGGKSEKDVKALASAENVSIKISSLPEHSSGFIPFSRVEHCKYIVADSEVGFVSTSNWGPSYFMGSRGAAVVFRGYEAVMTLEDIFSRAWNGPYVAPVDQGKDYEPVKRS